VCLATPCITSDADDTAKNNLDDFLAARQSCRRDAALDTLRLGMCRDMLQ
jgi:hypothetical protein